MPSCSSHHLTWVSLTLGVGYLFTAGPAKHSQCLDEGYLLTAAIPDIQRGIAPLGPPVPARPQLLGLLLPATSPGLRLGVAPQGHRPDLRHGVAPSSRSCAVAAWHSGQLSLTSHVGPPALSLEKIFFLLGANSY